MPTSHWASSRLCVPRNLQVLVQNIEIIKKKKVMSSLFDIALTTHAFPLSNFTSLLEASLHCHYFMHTHPTVLDPLISNHAGVFAH
jgi:hypothetical protein